MSNEAADLATELEREHDDHIASTRKQLETAIATARLAASVALNHIAELSSDRVYDVEYAEGSQVTPLVKNAFALLSGAEALAKQTHT